MKILSMTATFGKLDHKTLTLEPDLNVLEAPNEWGKSTWCAFLVAMLYGIATSSRSKKDFLADKERYAPWNGKPMAGSMEILWKNRKITLERSQKGKIPFGNFRAYETESNLDVPELTGENCGYVLLGVEREVFVRSAFLRGSDLPVGEDEALRRRLNALVTTGDESAAGDLLAQKLKKLKNDCRHNKTGLIPQAEAQRDQLQRKLEQLSQLADQTRQLQDRENVLNDYAAQLKNHQAALTYQKAMETRIHLQRANQALVEAETAATAAEEACRDLPTQQTAEQELQRLGQLQTQWAQLQQQEKDLPPMPAMPEIPAPFRGKQPEEIRQQVQADCIAYKELCKPAKPILLIFGLLVLIAAAGFVFVNWIFSLLCLLAGAVLMIFHSRKKAARGKKRQAIAAIYGNEDPDSWLARARAYCDSLADYQTNQHHRESRHQAYRERKESLDQMLQLLTGGKSLTETLEYWQQVLHLRRRQQLASGALAQARTNAQTVAALVQEFPEPDQPDSLNLSEEDTRLALQQTHQELHQLHQRLGQYQGQMELLGDRETIQRELSRVQSRIISLEEYNAALTLALETLNQATLELQRRFAPRISNRAKTLFSRLTGGRYDRLRLAADLSMEVAARDEDAPHGVLWRSEGTADQLYLALRLAVAEELTPDAPLVLDDALNRFDDARTAAALEILQEYAKNRQVILFTCQSREKQIIN